MLMFKILVVTFLVNSLPALMLFDSGANWSFVSQYFHMGLGMTLGELEYPLGVSFTNEHGVSRSSG